MDFIMYNADKTEMDVFVGRTNYSSLTYGTSLTVEDGFEDIFSAKTTYYNGTYVDQDGLYLVTNETSYLEYKPYIMGAIGFYAQTTKTLSLPRAFTGSFGGDLPIFEGYVPASKHLSGDFNGDGLTDAAIVTGLYMNINGLYNSGEVYFTNLNPTLTTDYTKLTGSILNFNTDDKYYTDDMNGDGKTDIIILKDGSIEVWGFNTDQELELLADYTNTEIATDKPLLRGDFNGDGKVDLAYPFATGSTVWKFLNLKGNYFLGVTTKAISGLEYYESSGSATESNTYNYLPLDFDGDGKTDIIRQNIYGVVANTSFSHYVYVFGLNKSNLTFDTSNTLSYTIDGYNFSGTFIAPDMLHPISDERPSIAFLRGNDVDIIDFNTSHNENVRLVSVDNNNHVSDISYDPYYDSQYYSDLTYPYGALVDLPNLKLVSSISESYYNSYNRTKEYSYYGATMHMKGLGLIGFRSFSESIWQGDDVAPQWTFSGFNVANRGELLYQAVIDDKPYSYHKPNSYLSMTEYEYDQDIESNGVFINNLVAITTEDTLKGIETTTTNTYDTYNDISISTITFPEGSKKTQFYRGSNPFGEELYYIGRPTFKIETNTLGTETFTTRQSYTYNDTQLLSATAKYGNDITSILESFEYDNFGNVTNKTTSATGVPDRSVSYSYNSSNGRFLESSTDLNGFTSTYINDQLNGTLLSETDHNGNTTSYEYDGWNRVTLETDYLGNSILTRYTDSSYSGRLFIYKTSSLRTDGITEYTYIDRMGHVYAKYKRNEFGQIVRQNFAYDVLGRIKSETKPYITDVQYTYYYYDEYNRPFQRVGYDGETITTEYDNLTTTVNNGREEKSTTIDAVGNILQVTDEGGTIDYTYYGNGSPKTTNCNGHTITAEIDGWGRKTRMEDPSAGAYSYNYDNYGQLTSETSPRGVTTYKYDDSGRIETKVISGHNTDMLVSYTYDTNMQISAKETIDFINSTSISYRYSYDDYQRPIQIIEAGTYGTFQKRYTYDAYGRVDLDQTISSSTVASGASGSIITQNIYSETSGALIAVQNQETGETLWQANSTNEYGDYTSIDLGNGITKTRTFDSYGMPTLFNDANDSGTVALNIDYAFNSETKNLTSRDNSFFTGEEVFSYDSQDRLKTISGAITHSQTYANNGNIDTNSEVGTYSYDPTTTYQIAGISLNTIGESYFENHTPQNISYNAFKKPVSIHEEGNGRVDFEYDASMNRKIAYYGGEDENIENRDFKKIYSSIAPVEIIYDIKNATSKIITYLMGDACNSPIAHIDKGTETEFVYIHRDHLGSVMAITDESASILEQTHYGAWGAIEKYSDAAGNTTLGYNSILGRGYTGHEHFTSVGLLHMNGRMYDANLGRFLSPDNFIQDPFNTQSFNRYSYVLNNPLKYIDPTGELSWKSVGKWIKANSQAITMVATIAVAVVATVATAGMASPLLAGAIVGAAAGVASGTIGTWTNGGSFLEGVGNGLIQGAFGAATGFLGAGAAQVAIKHVGSVVLNSTVLSGPAIRGIIGGVLGGGAGGFASGAASAALAGGSGSEILQAGLRSAAIGAIVGGIFGGAQGLKQAKADNVNAWTGKPIDSGSPTSLGEARSQVKGYLKNVDEVAPEQAVSH